MAQKRVLVGIDIAKEKIDAAIRLGAEASFANSAEGRRELVVWLKEHGVCKAVMEASGGYERSWARLLREAGVEVAIVDPKRVRHFAKSAGQLAKNDPIDARMIAWFGEVFGHGPGQPDDQERQELDQMVTARLGIARLKEQIESWAEHEQPKAVQKAHHALLKAVLAQIAKLEAIIAAKIAKTERFAQRAEIIQSVPGLAENTAAGLIAFLPELGLVDRQAASALLGAAPSMPTAASGTVNAISRADGASCESCCSWRFLAQRPSTIPCSKPATNASSPTARRPRSPSSLACVS